MKGLGGLFNKKKKNDSPDPNSANPPPSSNPNALIEMTTEVKSFSDASLDPKLFAVPAGYTRVQANADQIINTQPTRK